MMFSKELHQLMKPGHFYRLYYDLDKQYFKIVLVKVGDNLSRSPHNIENGFIVTNENLSETDIEGRKGIAFVNIKTMDYLFSKGYINGREMYLLFLHQKNEGFTINKSGSLRAVKRSKGA